MDKYLSSENNSCLTSQDGNITTSTCTPNNNRQQWLTHDYCSSEEDTEWKTTKGEHVILSQPDVPWYVLKRKTTTVNYDEQDIDHLNEVSYRNNADFKSQFKMDMCRPDLGYGYSYAQRHNNVMKQIEESNDKKIEGFDEKKIDFNVIAGLLILLIFLLVSVRSYITKTQ